MKRTIKGIFFKILIQAVEKKLGPKGLIGLKEKFGSLDFSAFKNYPMEEEVRLKKAAIEVLYGAENAEAELEFGKLAFHTYADSFIGKTMFSLTGNDFKRACQDVKKILETVTSGLEIEARQLEPKKMRIRIGNNPHHINHYKGVFMAAAEYFKAKATIEARTLGSENYEYIIEWQ